MDPKHKAILASVVTFGCGVGVGHILTKVRLEKTFKEQLAEEVRLLKEHFDKRKHKLHKTEEYATPEGARKAIEEEREEEPMPEEAKRALIRYSGKTVPGVVDPDERPRRDVTTADIYQEFQDRRAQEAEAFDTGGKPIEKPIVRQNIFSPGHPAALTEPTFVPAPREGDGEYEDERPFIMTFDQYNEDRHYTETEVVYYTGDRTVADENDDPIADGQVDEIFGWDNLAQFGDKFVIHIASPKLGKKYQVTRTDGEFAVMVGGFTEPDEVPEGDSG